MCLFVKYQKTGEMNSEYPFLFYLKSDFWMEIPDDKVNYFENKKDKRPQWRLSRTGKLSLYFISTY